MQDTVALSGKGHTLTDSLFSLRKLAYYVAHLQYSMNLCICLFIHSCTDVCHSVDCKQGCLLVHYNKCDLERTIKKLSGYKLIFWYNLHLFSCPLFFDFLCLL